MNIGRVDFPFMIEKVDHLGIAVRSLPNAIRFFEASLGLKCSRTEEVESQKVRIAFFKVGEISIELLEPTGEDSPIYKFLETRGEGIHHVAFQTDNIPDQLQLASRAGCRLIHEAPVEGGHGKQVAFLHPKTTLGVLIEFCSRPNSSADGSGDVR